MRVGAIDIGTNTVRMLVRDGHVEMARRAEVVGLGEGVDATGVLSEAAMDRTAAMLGEYGGVMRALGVERARAVATSACRDAANAGEFLDRIAPLLGVRPTVIGGDEEAALSFRGATGAVGGSGPSLVIDIGGGSTEFVFGERSISYSRSLDIGSVRLTDRLLSDRPASEERVADAARHVADAIATVGLPAGPQRVIGVAGTFTALAGVHLGLEVYDRTRVHASTLRVADLDDLVDRMSRLTIAETAALPSMDPKRAPVLLAGAVIAAEAIRHVGQAVIVSEYDLLDAMADDLLG